jgi:ribosomal protein S18 acetylase RimI-like enzyme
MASDDESPPTASDRPRPDGSDIRKIANADIAPVAAALARAFCSDPHFCWIVRDDTQRMQMLERGFELFIRRVWLPPDEGYTTDRYAGAALWMPPQTWHLGLIAQLRLLPGTIRRIRANTPRLLKALTFIERKHPRNPSHWYLPIVGVAPAWQGRGYGSALLGPILRRCDEQGQPAYLEASTPRNRALYERHGFEVIEECRYARDAPPLWPMWREPADRGHTESPSR